MTRWTRFAAGIVTALALGTVPAAAQDHPTYNGEVGQILFR